VSRDAAASLSRTFARRLSGFTLSSRAAVAVRGVGRAISGPGGCGGARRNNLSARSAVGRLARRQVRRQIWGCAL